MSQPQVLTCTHCPSCSWTNRCFIALKEACAGTYLGDFKELGGVQHPAVLCPLHSVPAAFVNPRDT